MADRASPVKEWMPGSKESPVPWGDLEASGIEAGRVQPEAVAHRWRRWSRRPRFPDPIAHSALAGCEQGRSRGAELGHGGDRPDGLRRRRWSRQPGASARRSGLAGAARDARVRPYTNEPPYAKTATLASIDAPEVPIVSGYDDSPVYPEPVLVDPVAPFDLAVRESVFPEMPSRCTWRRLLSPSTFRRFRLSRVSTTVPSARSRCSSLRPRMPTLLTRADADRRPTTAYGGGS